jgi:hypothetical protein
MATGIAAGANIRDIVFATLEADTSVLLPLLSNEVSRILPRRDIDVTKVHRPFIFIRLEGVAGGGDAMDQGVWAIEVHDRPGYGLERIDRIVDRLKVLFNHKPWPTPSGSTERPRKSWWAGATGELPDDPLKTIKRIARFQLVQS